MAAHDYKVAIALAMSSNHASVFSALAHGLAGIHVKVADLRKEFGRLHVAVGSAMAFSAGAGVLAIMGKIVNKTKEYSGELATIERLGLGMTTAVRSGAFEKQAFGIARGVGMDVTQAMKIPGMTYSILGDKEALGTWEKFAKLSVVLRNQTGYHGDPIKDIGDLVRAGEASGRFTDPKTKEIDPVKLNAFIDSAVKIISSTHSMVNSQTLLAMAKQGGFGLRGLSDEGYQSMAIMSQVLGGHRAGTALMSLGQQMMGGVMFKRSAQGLEKLGLLHHGEWSMDHNRVELTGPASKRLSGLIQKDPMLLAAKFMEQFQKKGITDPEDQMRMIYRTLGRQTSQRFTAEEINNFVQMKKEAMRTRAGFGEDDSYENIMAKSVPENIRQLSFAWGNLLNAVAGPQSPGIVNILKTLTSGLNWMGETIEHMKPETITAIATALGGFTAALTVLGAIGLIMAIPFGAVAAGIMLVGGAMYYLSTLTKEAKDWPIVKSTRAMLGVDDEKVRAENRAKLKAMFDSVANWFQTHSLRDLTIEWLNGVWNGIKIFFGMGQAVPGGPQGPGAVYGQIPQDRNVLGLTAEDRANNRAKVWDKITGFLAKAGETPVGIPTSFHPGEKEVKVPPMAMTLNIDSVPLSKAVAETLSTFSQFPTTPPAPNGWAASVGY